MTNQQTISELRAAKVAYYQAADSVRYYPTHDPRYNRAGEAALARARKRLDAAQAAHFGG